MITVMIDEDEQWDGYDKDVDEKILRMRGMSIEILRIREMWMAILG